MGRVAPIKTFELTSEEFLEELIEQNPYLIFDNREPVILRKMANKRRFQVKHLAVVNCRASFRGRI